MSLPATAVVPVLAERIGRLQSAAPDDELRESVRAAFLDWVGAALDGALTGPAAALVAGLDVATGGDPRPHLHASRLVGRNALAPVATAALINGTAAHTTEVDDIYAPGLFHPGAPVVAAAFAMADRVDASAHRLWRAINLGFEAGCRVAEDLGPTHYRHWHTTGTAGAIGAAVAAADLLGAGCEQFTHAMAVAATMCGGVQQTFRSDAAAKPLHAGAAAQSGIMAAVAAVGGVTGALNVLEGPVGLAAATGSATQWQRCRAELTRPLAIEQITRKPYPCCGHAFAAIGAALRLRERDVRFSSIRRIRVETYQTAIDVAGIAAPRTDAERRFSIPFLVSSALIAGRQHMFTASASADQRVPDLADIVSLEADAGFDAVFPARRGARVTIEMADSDPLRAEVSDRPGSPQNPLTQGDLDTKFVTAAEPVLGSQGAATLLAQIHALADDAPVRSLTLAPVSMTHEADQRKQRGL